jgi:FlaG/FlaF family flagellin (archaellin)
MLLEEEKNRIRAEEIFRYEVRREIEARRPKDSGGKRLWSLVNSTFGVWLLSSVVLGGLTFAYTTYQQQSAEKMRKAQAERRLKEEISGRVSNGLATMRQNRIRIERGEQGRTMEAVYNEAIGFLDNRVTSDSYTYDFSTYPEYKQRNFHSLTIELCALVGQSRLAALRASYDHLADLSGEAEKETVFHKDTSLDAVKKSIEILEQLQANSSLQL